MADESDPSIGGNYSQSNSSSNSNSTSGFSLLPANIQAAFNNYANLFNSQSGNFGNLSSLSPSENAGISTLAAGTAPTASSIASNIAMQQNPYDNDVISAIQRQFAGQGSQLSQAASNAGALGSNRYQLGANDINNTQAQAVGSFENNEFNTQLQNALTTIPQAQIQSAQGQLQAGAYQRNAPLTTLASLGSTLGVLPTSGGSTSTSSSQGSTTSGGASF